MNQQIRRDGNVIERGRGPKLAIDMPINEPLAKHFLCPAHLALDLLPFFLSFLLPLQPFLELLQTLFTFLGTPLLRWIHLGAIQRKGSL
jgi:hypothetical protein